MAYSTILSGLYIFTLKAKRHIEPGRLPLYPDPSTRDDFFLVVGEVHNPRKPVPAKDPYWLTIPERGLFTGIAIFGAVGAAKPAAACFPLRNRFLPTKPAIRPNALAGLILEVKGDFCRKVEDILDRHGRSEDYIEIGLDSEYRYNPLHNDLDAYALAYNIASLLNNLYGRGKEPFWQQAYTNLVKFVILLHKVAYDYVTLFDVYECTISPSLLAERIGEAEADRSGTPVHGRDDPRCIANTSRLSRAWVSFSILRKNRYLAPATPELSGRAQEERRSMGSSDGPRPRAGRSR